MEVNRQKVLYIDDSNKYHGMLTLGAERAGFQFIAKNNVLEALAFLQEYSSNVDAVILDLSFPDGEIQGVEALEIIKKQYEYLPIIILTGSDTAADIKKVVECMKKGAYSYVGKEKLNIPYLFGLVDSAVQQSRLLSYAKASLSLETSSSPCLVLKQDVIINQFTKKALFGYELISVCKPISEKEELELKINAIKWHQNLLRTLSTPFKDSLQLNLKYIAENGILKCRIIFSVYAEDEARLEQRIANTQHDIKAFFNGGSNPYLFEHINNEQILKDSLEFGSDYQYNLFFRTPIKVKTSTPLGFSTDSSDESLDLVYKPDEIFQIPTELCLDNELFRALNVQQEYTEIDIQVMPSVLQIEEIDLLKQICKQPSPLQYANSNQNELMTFLEFLNKIMYTTHDTFLVSVLLITKSTQVQQHVKSALEKYFFGYSQVQSNPRDFNEINRFKTKIDDNENRLPFFYSLDQTTQAFRLPLPNSKTIEGITSLPVYFSREPSNLPTHGILLGEKQTVNGKTPIKISEAALARHLYVMGQTGTGKSTLLKSMIVDCIDKSQGFAMIDPHGDLYDEVMKILPEHIKKSRLLTIDITNPEFSSKINPIAYDDRNPQSKSLVINELIRIFGTLYDMRLGGGSMFEQYFKNGLMLIMDELVEENLGKQTILNFADLFFNDAYRKKLLSNCKNKRIVDFFEHAHKTSGEQAFENFGPYITSKLTRFTDDYYLTPIISSETGNINFRKLIDDGNILLVKMDKGLIGADNVSLLGQMIISSIVHAAMSRANMEKHERKSFYLFIDEFQNFIKGDIGSALSEVRKYGLSLVLANQTLGQLKQQYAEVDIIESLMGNVGSMVFFRPGINDYEKIKQYLEPEFSRDDVLKLPNFNCIGRLMIDNIPSEPFVFQTKL